MGIVTRIPRINTDLHGFFRGLHAKGIPPGDTRRLDVPKASQWEISADFNSDLSEGDFL
jgi:hypothetical protein